MLCFGWIVIVFVKAAGRIDLTSVACAWRPVTAFAGKLDKILAFRETCSFVLAVLIIRAFPWQEALMLQFSMKLDFFAYGGIVLANYSGDGSLSRTVSDTGFDDPPLFGCEMCDFFIGIHEKPSFPEGIVRNPNYIEMKDLFPCL